MSEPKSNPQANTSKRDRNQPLKSFGVCCPECHSSDAISLDLNDLVKITCSECGAEFTPEQAVQRTRAKLHRWEAVAAWIGRATLDPE
jgi:Zn ribbon nucleic-acid-binding protein